MLQKQARDGLSGAGEQWQGWQFTGNYLVSPDGRQVSPDDLYLALAGLDAMTDARNRPRVQMSYTTAEVIQLA